ncbi:hypothetical protein [Tenacibaculum todarodis]|uniref:hypothetical protein n=1 Tax=Tenacibaculum todarodis TaxID=1850252 RepID=UPI0013016DC1|nr:hypothetical protein [Tenacibaculum todarodis]
MNEEKSSLEKIENSILDKLNPNQKIAYDLGDKGGSWISKMIDKVVDFVIPEKK